MRPRGNGGTGIDLYDLVHVSARPRPGLPLLIRFSDILAARIRGLVRVLRQRDRRARVQGQATAAVYPIKVNQQRHVVEELVELRPRLRRRPRGRQQARAAGRARADHDNPERADHLQRLQGREYIEIALLAQKLGRTPIIVIDRFHELELVIQVARELGIRPHIGVRAKLAREGRRQVGRVGRRPLASSASPPTEMVEAVERLRADEHARLPRAAALPHRLADHRRSARIKRRDAARRRRFYVELHEMGAGAQVPRRRRRPRRRLRRLADQLPRRR